MEQTVADGSRVRKEEFPRAGKNYSHPPATDNAKTVPILETTLGEHM